MCVSSVGHNNLPTHRFSTLCGDTITSVCEGIYLVNLLNEHK